MNEKNNRGSQKREYKNKEEFVEWLKDRTRKFAIKTVQFCQELPKNQATQVVSYQLIKSATSVSANYRAACRGRSGAEFYSKMCTVVEESDESMFWFEVIKESSMSADKGELEFLLSEAVEIVALMTSIRKSTGYNLK